MKEKSKLEARVSPLLLTLTVVFVSVLIMSNILANQMLSFGAWSFDAGTLLFPITYILSDVFSEVYGYRWSRRVAWYATLMNLVMVLFITASIYLPHPEWYDASHFQLAVGGSFRIVVASLVSYQVGDFVNDLIFRRMKRNISTNKGFGWRAILSSIGGAWVDTILFVNIAFIGVIPVNEIFPMMLINVFIKVTYEIIILPITSKVVRKVQAKENEYAQNVQQFKI